MASVVEGTGGGEDSFSVFILEVLAFFFDSMGVELADELLTLPGERRFLSVESGLVIAQALFGRPT